MTRVPQAPILSLEYSTYFLGEIAFVFTGALDSYPSYQKFYCFVFPLVEYACLGQALSLTHTLNIQKPLGIKKK